MHLLRLLDRSNASRLDVETRERLVLALDPDAGGAVYVWQIDDPFHGFGGVIPT